MERKRDSLDQRIEQNKIIQLNQLGSLFNIPVESGQQNQNQGNMQQMTARDNFEYFRSSFRSQNRQKQAEAWDAFQRLYNSGRSLNDLLQQSPDMTNQQQERGQRPPSPIMISSSNNPMRKHESKKAPSLLGRGFSAFSLLSKNNDNKNNLLNGMPIPSHNRNNDGNLLMAPSNEMMVATGPEVDRISHLSCLSRRSQRLLQMQRAQNLSNDSRGTSN